MLSHLLIIILELGLGFTLPIPSILLLIQDRFNRINKIFAMISMSLGFSLVFDSLNRLFFHLYMPVGDYLFRLSDCLLILAGICLVYHGRAFPRRMFFITSRKSFFHPDRGTRNTASYLGLMWTGALLAIFSFTPYYISGGEFNQITGVYMAKTGPVFYAIRLYFISTLIWTMKFQIQFYHNSGHDPRKLHSRYYIYATTFLGLVFLMVEILKKVSWIENELMALWSISCFIYIIFLYNIFSNIGISYRSGLTRLFLYIFIYILLLSPFVVLTYQLVRLSDKFPLWLIVSLTSLLFLGFQYMGSGIFPLIRKFFFSKTRQQTQAIGAYNMKIQELNSNESHHIHHRLLEFLQTNYKPRFMSFYYLIPDKNLSSSFMSSNISLVKDSFTALEIQGKNRSPDHLPPEILQLLYKLLKEDIYGGLIVDLLYKVERLGLSDWVDQLVNLSACGAEIILPLFQLKDLEDQNSTNDSPSDLPLGVLLVGELESKQSLDKEDLFVLQLLVTPTVLALKNHYLLNSTLNLKEQLEEENRKISTKLIDDIILPENKISDAGILFSKESSMNDIVNQARLFAKNNSPILITGETGTGKSQLAQFIHENSRPNQKMITLNCSAIPVDLIENELFGHEKGAYTGATETRDGVLEKARDSTLFMDEIGELPIESQIKLLRLLQSGEYERIGSNDTRKTNARFIFATNRILDDEIKAGNFRLDLYYRISTFELDLPPLRQRKQDLPVLIARILEKTALKLGEETIKISNEAMEKLLSYNYPGNIRELENLIFRAAVLKDSTIITPQHLPVLFTNRMKLSDKKNKVTRLNRELENLEKEMILEAMELKDGNQREAAELLNISRGALQYKLKQFRLKN